MDEDIKKDLETIGCRVQDDNDRIVVTCPLSAIEKGIKISSSWDIEDAKKEDKDLVLRFKRKIEVEEE